MSDVYMLRLLGSRFRHPEPWSRLRDCPKQDACLDGFGLVYRTVEFDLRPPYAVDFSDGCVGLWGLVFVVDPGRHLFYSTRG